MWLIGRQLKRRSVKPAWNSLTREEQGIVVRNRQRGTYAVHGLADAYSTPNFTPASRRY
jgi:hypothetical protein